MSGACSAAERPRGARRGGPWSQLVSLTRSSRSPWPPIAVIGAVLGSALGLALGAALAAAFTYSQQATVSIPGAQIAAYIVVTAAAGVLAAISPARRAARLNVLAAIAAE